MHGVDGPVAIINARVAAFIERHLRDVRIQHRGVDPEIDAGLVALATVAAQWRDQHAPGSADGPNLRNYAEPVPTSGPMSTSEAATRLHLGERAVRKACATGRLDAELVAGRWLITPEALAHYRAARATA